MNNQALGTTAQGAVENTVNNVMGDIMSGDIGRVNRGTAAQRRNNFGQQSSNDSRSNITD